MKKHLSAVFLVIFFLISPIFLQTGNIEVGKFSGSFTIRDNQSFCVFIEHAWERNGQTPVILAFSDLVIKLWVDADDWDTLNLENRVNERLFDDLFFPFFIYEQNVMRTRMIVAGNNRGFLKLKISSREQVELYFGETRLNLPPMHVVFKESEQAPGELYQLMFIGPNISCGKQLLYLSSTEMIYTAPGYDKRFEDRIPRERTDWTTWAVKDSRKQDLPLIVDKNNER